MAASLAIDGFGWTFDIGASPLTDNEILSISFPSFTKDILDVSHGSSPGHYREFISAFLDGGEVAVELNYTQTDFEELKAVFDVAAAQAFTINIVDDNYGTTDPDWTFNGHITGLPVVGGAEEKVTMSVTIKVTGNPVFTAGTQV